MSHVRKSSVYDYFDEEPDTFKCTVTDEDKVCGMAVKKMKTGSAAGNLKRHLQRSHQAEHKAVQEKDEANAKAVEKGQQRLSSFLAPTNVSMTIAISQKDFKDGILQMVAYSAVALTFFQSKGFLTINGPTAAKLGVPLGRHAISEMVLKRSEEKKKLMKEIEGKFFFLKFDGVTRLRSHFLGVTIQYWTGKQLAVKTLGLIDTKAHHGSQHLKQFVCDLMTSFGLPMSRILCCVVDNAANMTKTIQLLNEEKENENRDNRPDEMEEGEEGEEEEEGKEGEEEEAENEEEEEDSEFSDEQFPDMDAAIHHMRYASVLFPCRGSIVELYSNGPKSNKNLSLRYETFDFQALSI